MPVYRGQQSVNDVKRATVGLSRWRLDGLVVSHVRRYYLHVQMSLYEHSAFKISRKQ